MAKPTSHSNKLPKNTELYSKPFPHQLSRTEKTLPCAPFLVRESSRLIGAGLPKTRFHFHSMKFIGSMPYSLNFF
jgi:hypothetical protein